MKKENNKLTVREGIHPPCFHVTTEYFQHIKDEYGQYTYDVLVGKFIHLSNQFNDMFALTEWHMYGSSRLGVHKPMSPLGGGAGGGSTGRQLVHIEFEGTWNQYTQSFTDTGNTTTTTYQMSYDYFTLTRGEKNYEMVNHLGNVLVIISDKKLKTCEGDTVNYYMADVLQATDYSAFHATLKDRVWYANANKKYRFGGSNGQERDDEVSGEGRSYSAEFWQYSPDLGRRFNVDPLNKEMPSWSSYSSNFNSPISYIDPKGLSPTTRYVDKNGKLLLDTKDGNNSEVVITDDNMQKFKDFLKEGSQRNKLNNPRFNMAFIYSVTKPTQQVFFTNSKYGFEYMDYAQGKGNKEYAGYRLSGGKFLVDAIEGVDQQTGRYEYNSYSSCYPYQPLINGTLKYGDVIYKVTAFVHTHPTYEVFSNEPGNPAENTLTDPEAGDISTFINEKGYFYKNNIKEFLLIAPKNMRRLKADSVKPGERQTWKITDLGKKRWYFLK